MVNLKNSSFFNYGDNYYDIIGYVEKTKKVIIEKTNKSSIYYANHTTTQITRKLSKTKTIKIENITYSLAEMNGV